MPAKDDAYYASLSDETFLADFHGPAMYTTEGDDAVRAAIEVAKTLAANDLTIRNKATLTKAVSPLFRAIAEAHPEIWDTEPRAWIGNRLDEVCKDHGWAFEPWEAYDW